MCCLKRREDKSSGGTDLHERVESFIDHGHEHAIHNEAGAVLRDAGLLPQEVRQPLRCVVHLHAPPFSIRITPPLTGMSCLLCTSCQTRLAARCHS